ncbi:MAG: hypothetical protein OSJ54_11265 [Oscillospiraceae bacterium]|nr:hypothetical protein [Oscillospiraceae bacterium]
MFKVTDILPIGGGLSITLDGDSGKITNGCKLIDDNGNVIVVKSVAMVRYTDPQYIGKDVTVLVDKCDIAVGSTLSIA